MSHSHAMRLILTILLIGMSPVTNLPSTINHVSAENIGQAIGSSGGGSRTGDETSWVDNQLTQSPLESMPIGSRSIDFEALPLYFVENQGQLDRKVAFHVLGGGNQVFFTANGVTFVLSQPDFQSNQFQAVNNATNTFRTDGKNSTDTRWTVNLNFIGAKRAFPVGEERSEATVSYFTGSRDHWETTVATYQQLVYHELWPGIDLVFYGQTGQLKYEFRLQAGANPRNIILQYDGAQQVRLDEAGNLAVSTPLGRFTDQAPTAWQPGKAGNQTVIVSYSLGQKFLYKQSPNFQAVNYSFNLGAYDPSKELVIDPAVVVQCGYIGGTYSDAVRDIALDTEGNIYVTGETTSDQSSFPVTVGPDLTQNQNTDAFVAKINPSGTALIYAGYIGGAHQDYGWGIAVDNDGNAYIAGDTMSAADTFPELVGPYLALRGAMDGFVAKVNPNGTALLYCGYIGGHVWDHAFDIAVDGDGNAYVAGSAGSDEGSFPVIVGPDLVFNGVEDAYIAKVKADGTGFVYAGYIGGDNWDRADGVAVDAAGNAYVVGQTKSTEATFPEAVGPDLTHNGNYDAFVAKVSTTGSTLEFAGYIGGSADDIGWDVILDGDNNVYVVGETASTEATFPETVGPDLSYNGGERDAFIAKVLSSGLSLVYCGYIGGNGGDWAMDIGLDDEDNAYLIGYTNSDPTTFPRLNGPDSSYNGGGSDAFISKVENLGTQLLYSGYIGGTGADYGTSIAVTGDGTAYVGGITSSDQGSFPVRFWFDLSHNGDYDGFVAKVSMLFRFFVPFTVR